tara:strand:+ start:248 stop:940 length:693 start_codon:yes stop_codon:yes gene_type:complete
MKNKYSVKSVLNSECREWFLRKHYLKRLPPISYCFGLYDENLSLLGVSSFGRPAAHGVVKGAFGGILMDNFLELNRLIINEGLPKNILSFFLSRSLNLLPKPQAIVSYADTSQGHHGYIYQATNWIYTGLSAKRKDYKLKGVNNLHSQSLLDREGRHMKKGKVAEMRLKYGDDLYTQDRPRKHRYFYFVGNKKEKAHMKENLQYKVEPYPKGDNSRYDASYVPTVQGILF